MLQVWGRTNSSNVMKVLWLLDELGLAFERIDAGLQHGRTDTEEYGAMSPFRLVPALRDEATALFESNTILRYLCNAHAPSSSLYPQGAAARAEVECWMDAQLASFARFGTVFQQLVRTTPAKRDMAAVDDALTPSAAAFAVLDERLAGRDFLVGDHLTLADIAFGPLVHRWFALPVERPDLPGLHAYYRRLLQRPAYEARCAAPLS